MKIHNDNISHLYHAGTDGGSPDHVGPPFNLAVFKLRIMYYFGEIIQFSLA